MQHFMVTLFAGRFLLFIIVLFVMPQDLFEKRRGVFRGGSVLRYLRCYRLHEFRQGYVYRALCRRMFGPASQ
jgi:hypothetical protein